MDAVDILHQIAEDSMRGYGLTDLAVGTVVSVKPLQIKVREDMAPLPEETLWLTAAVMEKKIPVLRHKHVTAGFRHDHSLPELAHSHETEEGGTGVALDGPLRTETALNPDAYTSDERLENILCYEDGKPLPVKDGYILLNRALEAGDRVLLLRVLRGQQFIVLSRIFEKGARHAAKI